MSRVIYVNGKEYRTLTEAAEAVGVTNIKLYTSLLGQKEIMLNKKKIKIIDMYVREPNDADVPKNRRNLLLKYPFQQHPLERGLPGVYR